jgi:flagellar hook-associated protein 1 FlgK
MQNYAIGLSGIDAARDGLYVIANNIANAATEGYHRQRIELRPETPIHVESLLLGQGVDVVGITRLIDTLLESEILGHQSSLGQVSQELGTLTTIENSFGEFSTDGGLNAAIDDFFNAMHDLSAHPNDVIYQQQAASAAETMANQFRALGEFLSDVQVQIRRDAETTGSRNSMTT